MTRKAPLRMMSAFASGLRDRKRSSLYPISSLHEKVEPSSRYSWISANSFARKVAWAVRMVPCVAFERDQGKAVNKSGRQAAPHIDCPRQSISFRDISSICGLNHVQNHLCWNESICVHDCAPWFPNHTSPPAPTRPPLTSVPPSQPDPISNLYLHSSPT